MSGPQKKTTKKVLFEDGPSTTADHTIIELEDIFDRYSINAHRGLPSEQLISSQISQMEGTAKKSYRILRKEGTQCLTKLHKLLAKQINDSLKMIVDQIFEEASEDTDTNQSIKVLTIFHQLLSTPNLNEKNSCKILKWLYDILALSSYSLCLELSNIIYSAKKKLLRLGFLILSKYKDVNCEGINTQDEEVFKMMVEELILQKQKQVSSLQFEICRVCERYFPLLKIGFHLAECERKHEIMYHEARMEQKGVELLAIINQDRKEDSDVLELFNKLFTSFKNKVAFFKLKNNTGALSQAIETHKDTLERLEASTAHISNLKSLLYKYLELKTQEGGGQILSDKDSRKSRSRTVVSIRGIDQSSTSLQPEVLALHQSHSQKTIMSQNESGSRYSSVRLEDFQILDKLGRGAYSEVFLVRKRNTQDLFAMKVMQIEDLNEERMGAFKKQQKIYKSIAGVFNVKLYYSFREDNLYCFVLDYGCGGTLKSLLKDQVYLEESYARVYLANLVLAVESLHSMDIIHRDLKPVRLLQFQDNIVIAEKGKLILTDFNLCKLIKQKQLEKPNSFYGTPDYISPEILNGQPVTEAIDWFSLGIIAYEMLVGVTPFGDNSVQAVFDNILKGQVDWPKVGTEEDQISAECKDLMEKLLEADPKRRLGSNGSEEIKNHPFFKGVNWSNIYQNQFYFIPEKVEEYEQDIYLRRGIEQKKKKMNIEHIDGQESIVRYDVLKQATNKKARSRRSSRFKLQKQLQDLKYQPHSIKVRKQHSHNNFQPQYNDIIRTSCHDFIHGQQAEQ